MDESLGDGRREEGLLGALTEAIRELGAVRVCRNRGGAAGGRRRGGEPGRGGGEGMWGGMLGPAEREERRGEEEEEEGEEEEECKRKVVGALRELSGLHADRVTAWRDALRECARMLAKCPPGGSDQQQHASTADAEDEDTDSFRNTFLHVGEDVQNITDTMNAIITKLDKELLKLHEEESSAIDEALQETRDPEVPERPDEDHVDPHDEFVSGNEQDAGDGGGQSHENPSADSRFSASDCKDEKEELLGRRQEDFEPPGSSADFQKDKMHRDWITVRLAGQQEDSRSDVPDARSIRAPPGVAEVLTCEAADALSCLMVAGSEELVSRVVRVKVQEGAKVDFPVSVAVPFCARYRGGYRDVAVKVVDGERRASYVTPVTTEGAPGGQRGSFAEVKVYSLGLFAVVSCLKRENYTIPTKGLSLKLPMDLRIGLNYLPGSFAAPVMAQTMIQPVDAVLLAAVKSRRDAHHSVVSTSPLLYLTHPSSQPLRRPLTLTLPCAPNPEKKSPARGRGEDPETQLVSGSVAWDQHASHRRRILGAPAKPKEIRDELLIALGSGEKQWSVLDKVTVRNQQNGLVSFELTENYDRLLVVRLLSPSQPCQLTSLAEELEESVCSHSVTVVLQRRQDEPDVVLLAALPSRDLNWELSKLRAQGYGGLPEASPEISMCEGDQLLLSFSGNITSTGTQSDRRDEGPRERITFHSQQKNRLLLRLTEVDPFGNYSSPHYKGTAVFYKVARGRLEWRGDRPEPLDRKLLGDPVCKLSLTLPKKDRTIHRPIIARVKLCEETDSLSDSLLLWLSEELSEEEVALLVLSLRLRRSAAQLVKLRARDSLSAQAFHVLAMWRRGLPAVTPQPKASQLAHCLAKSGRPDLARELLLRQAAAAAGKDTLKRGSLKSRNHTAC